MHKGIAKRTWLTTSGGDIKAPKINNNIKANFLCFIRLLIETKLSLVAINKSKGVKNIQIIVKKTLTKVNTYSFNLPSK
jgi:hypothetical protein